MSEDKTVVGRAIPMAAPAISVDMLDSLDGLQDLVDAALRLVRETREKLCEPRGAEVSLRFPVPDCKRDLAAALAGSDLAGIICDLQEYLRKRLKYETLEDPVYDALDQVREQVYELLADRGVNINTIIE